MTQLQPDPELQQQQPPLSFRSSAVPETSAKELERIYRVARQMLGMHALLRDRYSRRVLILRCILIAASAVFCATTFAGDDLYAQLSMNPTPARFVLKGFSLLSFITTLIMLVAGWDARATRHEDAVKRFTNVVALFRRFRDNPEAPDAPQPDELHSSYWKACADAIPIPNRLFASLKARYLLDVEVSRILDHSPGCPAWVIRWILRIRSMFRAFREATKVGVNVPDPVKSVDSTPPAGGFPPP